MILWRGREVPENGPDYMVYAAYQMRFIAEDGILGLLRFNKSKETGEWSHRYYGYFFNLRKKPLFGYYHDYYDGDWYTFGLGWIQFSWQPYWVMP